MPRPAVLTAFSNTLEGQKLVFWLADVSANNRRGTGLAKTISKIQEYDAEDRDHIPSG